MLRVDLAAEEVAAGLLGREQGRSAAGEGIIDGLALGVLEELREQVDRFLGRVVLVARALAAQHVAQRGAAGLELDPGSEVDRLVLMPPGASHAGGLLVPDQHRAELIPQRLDRLADLVDLPPVGEDIAAAARGRAADRLLDQREQPGGREVVAGDRRGLAAGSGDFAPLAADRPDAAARLLKTARAVGRVGQDDLGGRVAEEVRDRVGVGRVAAEDPVSLAGSPP